MEILETALDDAHRIGLYAHLENYQVGDTGESAAEILSAEFSEPEYTRYTNAVISMESIMFPDPEEHSDFTLEGLREEFGASLPEVISVLAEQGRIPPRNAYLARLAFHGIAAQDIIRLSKCDFKTQELELGGMLDLMSARYGLITT
tara:strand:+ start:15 stop:455 length:441 start_codon:yes stop_codon:yes gene_type:complete